MKAVLCTHYGPPEELAVTDVEAPTPDRGQVVLAVKAAGVNFPDTLIIQGKYQLQPPLPFAPGSEVAGIVKSVGAGVDPSLVGARAMAFTAYGGFAEEVAVDANVLVPIPDGVDLKTAAAFGLTYGTAYHALKDRALLSTGETALVLGAGGGVGLAAVELAKLLGARVIAAASTDAKLEVCRRYGADEVINYASENLRDRMKALTTGTGANVVFDPVGGAYSKPALRSTAWDGRYLVIGFASGEIPRIPLNLPLLKGCAVVGVFWGSFAARESQRNRANLQQLVSLARRRQDQAAGLRDVSLERRRFRPQRAAGSQRHG